MYRRDFLKISGLASAALFMQINPLGKIAFHPTEVAAQGKLYRGTSDGKILVSHNAGKNWELHTNFGSQFSVMGLATDLFGQIHAHLGFEGHLVDLALMKNGKIWKTT